MIRLTVRAVALLMFALPALAQAPPSKYALLVGLNDYQFPASGIPPLAWALDDVKSLREALTAQGFKVVALPNESATRQMVVAELSRHSFVVKEQDTFLLYYAGHGVRSQIGRKSTYWLTYNAQLTALDVDGIRLTHLLDYVADIPARRKIVLLDHCFSGDLVTEPAPASPAGGTTPVPADGGGGARGPGGAVRLERGGTPVPDLQNAFNASSSELTILAASRGDAFEITSRGHGVFTAVLLEALTSRSADTNRDAKLSMDELRNYIRSRVPEISQQEAGAVQTPLERVSAVNPGVWFLAENLPVGSASEVRQIAQRYKQKLTLWQLQSKIQSEVKAFFWELLDKWEESQGGGRSLTEQEQRTITALRDTIDSANVPDDSKADQLKILHTVLVQGP